jgi:uncharacterized protein YrrD
MGHMVTRWHLLHLPIRVAGQHHVMGFAEEVIIRWPGAAIEGFGLHSSKGHRFLPRDSVHVCAMALEIADRSLIETRTRQWWMAQRECWPFINQPVFAGNGQLIGRVKDVLIDENTLAIHQVVISRGLLADLVAGALLIPVHQFREDETGRIKIGTTGAL